MISTGARARHKLIVVRLTYLTAESQHSLEPRFPRGSGCHLTPRDSAAPPLSPAISACGAPGGAGAAHGVPSAFLGEDRRHLHLLVAVIKPLPPCNQLLLTSVDERFVTSTDNTHRKQSGVNPQGLHSCCARRHPAAAKWLLTAPFQTDQHQRTQAMFTGGCQVLQLFRMPPCTALAV